MRWAFADGIVLYIRDPETQPKTLRANKYFQQSGKMQDSHTQSVAFLLQDSHTQSVAFLFSNVKHTERYIGNNSITVATKTVKYIGINLVRKKRPLQWKL